MSHGYCLTRTKNVSRPSTLLNAVVVDSQAWSACPARICSKNLSSTARPSFGSGCVELVTARAEHYERQRGKRCTGDDPTYSATMFGRD